MSTEPKTKPTPEPEPLTDEQKINFVIATAIGGLCAGNIEVPVSLREWSFKEGQAALDAISDAAGIESLILDVIGIASRAAARDAEIEKTRALVAEAEKICEKPICPAPEWIIWRDKGMTTTCAAEMKWRIQEALRPHLPEERKL